MAGATTESVLLLGPLRVIRNGIPLPLPRSRKVRALLAYLVMVPSPTARERLCELFWDVANDPRSELRWCLSKLRPLVDTPERIRLIADREKVGVDSSQLDVDALRLARSAQATLSGGLPENLQPLRALYRGEFLEGLSLDSALPFDNWLAGQRHRFGRLRQRLLQRLSEVLPSESDDRLEVLRERIEAEPFDEAVHIELIRTLFRRALRAEAEHQIEASLARFQTEGADSTSLRSAFAELKRSLSRKAVVPSRDLIRTDSGRGYQFTGAPGVPPRSAGGRADLSADGMDSKSAAMATNLAEVVSELIGRDHEISEILNLVSGHRLVTLTGAGGIGKTRLALALARELLPHFADGVWLVEFSPIADQGLVPATVAATVGLDLGGGDMSIQNVAQALAGQRLLLVLDTCEHVIDAAAALAEGVLQAGSAVHVIATSREPLRAEGEWLYPVPALAVPAESAAANDDPLQYAAVRLFIERLRAVRPHMASHRSFTAMVVAICRRLDGIPLAIELAAARAATLGIDELAARLNDRFHLLTGGRRTALPRHQTLRATLDWSYQLLAEAERIVLRRLAIFAGPFALEATTAVVADSAIAPLEAVEGIADLLSKSLLSQSVDSTVTRYLLLDTKAHLVYVVPLASIKAAGTDFDSGDLARQSQLLPSSDWSVRDVGPAESIQLTLGDYGRTLEVQIPHPPDLRAFY